MADDADKINEPYRAPEQLRTEPPPPGYFEGESLTRRKVFTIAVQAIGGLAGAAIVLPAVGFAVAPIFHRGKERWEIIGPTGNFVEDTYRQVVFTETPGIGDIGKTTAYVRKSSKELGEEPGQYIAVSNRCAHLGCPVRFVQDAGNFICPCHG
ncbi:MAG TPA: Rieske 2Fe-2S domain-containing protein, partial [Solirubrobacterales bacterium]|nr:Rieske 2Fe-2S domain-containing protein [Solirubrobacterales bacterium]